MITNDTANMHYLVQADQTFFENKFKEIFDRLERIKKEHELKGNWAPSEDFKWLVKVGD